jgi:hypothetical protein
MRAKSCQGRTRALMPRESLRRETKRSTCVPGLAYAEGLRHPSKADSGPRFRECSRRRIFMLRAAVADSGSHAICQVRTLTLVSRECTRQQQWSSSWRTPASFRRMLAVSVKSGLWLLRQENACDSSHSTRRWRTRTPASRECRDVLPRRV